LFIISPRKYMENTFFSIYPRNPGHKKISFKIIYFKGNYILYPKLNQEK